MLSLTITTFSTIITMRLPISLCGFAKPLMISIFLKFYFYNLESKWFLLGERIPLVFMPGLEIKIYKSFTEGGFSM